MHTALEPGIEICKTSIEQNFNQSELLQLGHEPRLDLHTTLEPGSEILQDLKLSKSPRKSELSQTGQEPQHDLHTVKLHPHRTFLETLCQ